MTTLALPNQPTLTVPWKRPEDEEQTPQPSQPASPAIVAPAAPKAGSAETPGMIGDPRGLVQTLGLAKPQAVAPQQPSAGDTPGGGMTRVDGGVQPVTYGGGQAHPVATDTRGSTAAPASNAPPAPTTPKLPPMPVAPPPPPPPPPPNFAAASTARLPWSTTDAVGQAGATNAPALQGSGGTDIESVLRNLLQNPYRYDQQAGEQAIHDRFGRQQEDADRSQDELYSSRGLVGSSVEAEGHRRISEDIRNAEAGQLFDLQREMANTAGADRSAAAQIALALRGQGLQQQQMDEQVRQFDASSETQKQQFLENLNVTKEQVAQRATEIQNQAQQAGRSMTLAEAQAQAQNALAKEGLALQGKQLSQQGEQFSAAQQQAHQEFVASLNLNQQQVDQRATEIQNQAQQAGRQMSLAEAQAQAQNDLANRELTERKRQFDSADATQRQQFLDTLKISQQQVDQRAAELQQQESQFGRSLSSEGARFRAQQEFADKGFAENQRQFGATMDQRKSEFDLDALLRLLQSLGFQ